MVDLDQQLYKLMADFEQCFAEGAPSLIDCETIKVAGRMKFSAGVVCRGKVEFLNASPDLRTVRSGTYANERREV